MGVYGFTILVNHGYCQPCSSRRHINVSRQIPGNIQVTSIVKSAGGCDTLTFNWMRNNLKAMLVKQKNMA
jgi:hypothetical protein